MVRAVSLKLGETFVPGHHRDDIGALLGAAERLGYPAAVVRTQTDGLIVPTEVHEEAYPPPKSSAPAAAASKSDTPKAPAKKASAKKSGEVT